MSKFLGIFILFFILESISGARILFFFSGGTYSHEISVAPIVKRLSIDHNITFLSAHKKKPFDLPSVEVIAPRVLSDLIEEAYAVDRIGDRLDHKELHIWHELPLISTTICDILLNSDDIELQNLFRKRQFDLVFIDAVLCDCGFIASYIFNAKSIIIDSTTVLPWYYDIYHLPKESAWIPMMTTAFQYPMRFYDRWLNFFQNFYWTAVRRLKMYPALELTMRKFFGHIDYPSFLELERNTSLVFLNTHHSTDYPRSLPPWFVQIGGLQCWDEDAPIPKDVLSFMEKSEKIVLIAFGSSVDMDKMPWEKLSIFMESVRRMAHVNFIWKWNGKLPENPPKNALFVKWLPQKEILGHKKTVGFISHSGLNGIMETTYHGVPIIVIPLFADQDSNAYRIDSEKIGIRLEIRDMTEITLSKAIQEIISNKLYSNNMGKFSKAFRDRPMNPVDTALFWINYVLTHDDLSPLKPKLAHLSFLELYHFDMAIAIFLLALLSVLIFIFLLKCLISQGSRAVSERKSAMKKTVRKKKN